MTETLWMLSQAAGKSASPQGNPGNPLFDMLPLMMIMGLIFYFLMFRPQSKEKKRRAQMLAALKKNDRVITIGGIVGTVTSVRDEEVTLKVDESSNTKITFSRSAIQRVVSETGADSGESAGKR
ncbi:MAG: preprotein translocase subunit YajC [Phycisphaerae bacterium]